MLNSIFKYSYGGIICLIIAIPSLILGNLFPVIGGQIIAIILGMLIAFVWHEKKF